MFKKAQNTQGKVKINIYGEAGSGKSFTSLLIAEGLSKKYDGKKIAVIDSEKGYDFYSCKIESRKVHPEKFDFDIETTKSIFEASDAAKEAIESPDYGVIIVDSVSGYYEAAKNAWPGKRNKIGAFPIYAWQKIYEFYDALINPLLDCNKHVIFCGRLGNIYSNDNDEMKVIGTRMKAKNEQAYETQMLFQMVNVKNNISLYAEKDRSSVLQGKTIKWPNFENTIGNVMQYLDGKHTPIGKPDDVSRAVMNDSESHKLLERMKAKIGHCKSKKELDSIKGELGEVKTKIINEHIAELTACFVEKNNSFDGKANSVLDKIRS